MSLRKYPTDYNKTHPYILAVHLPVVSRDNRSNERKYVKQFETDKARSIEKMFIMGTIEQGKGIALQGFVDPDGITQHPYLAPDTARMIMITEFDLIYPAKEDPASVAETILKAKSG